MACLINFIVFTMLLLACKLNRMEDLRFLVTENFSGLINEAKEIFDFYNCNYVFSTDSDKPTFEKIKNIQTLKMHYIFLFFSTKRTYWHSSE